MTLNELKQKYLGKRVAVYDGVVRHIDVVRDVQPNGSLDLERAYTQSVHYKQVRLLKPKESPVLYIKKEFFDEYSACFCLYSEQEVLRRQDIENFVKVRLVRVKE